MKICKKHQTFEVMGVNSWVKMQVKKIDTSCFSARHQGSWLNGFDRSAFHVLFLYYYAFDMYYYTFDRSAFYVLFQNL